MSYRMTAESNRRRARSPTPSKSGLRNVGKTDIHRSLSNYYSMLISTKTKTLVTSPQNCVSFNHQKLYK